MITFSHPLVLLLAVPLFGLITWIWRNGYGNLSPRRMRWALAVRLTIVSALILGLAGTALHLSQSRQAVVVVADLSASDAAQRTTVQGFVNSAAGRRPEGSRLGVTSVGRQPVVEQPVSSLDGFDGFQSALDPNYTDLESGLDLANALLPGGYRHRVVLVSDGQQNVGDAVSAARLLHSQGTRVDVVAARVRSGPEVLIDRLEVPPQLRPAENFSLAVDVRSTIATTTGLSVFRDRSPVGSKQERLRVGENHFVFQESPLGPGFHTFQVDITPAHDTQPENNQATAFTSVAGPAKVLVIAAHPSEATNVVASLKTTGVKVTQRTPGQVVPDLGFLQTYAAVVIVDTAADVLGPALVQQLVPYVRDLGHGLVVIGGQESYGMGGYGNTPLEQALPVQMNLPKRRDLPTAAVALIIESLEEDTQINISKEAGKGVVNLLTPRDYVAVNDAPYDNSAGWVVPLQRVTNKQAIDGAIDRMDPGDPQTYAEDLQSAYDLLKRSNARIKHIILLGDGDAEDPSYQSLVERIRAGGVTVSTIATNGQGLNDFQTMKNIAQWGSGRYYRADDPTKIPLIFLREARTVARSGIIQGKFYPEQLSSNPMLRDVRSVPPLYGYVATTPKPTGEMVLVSRKLDPVLAGWQFGLGRSVAWTSDAAGLWTQDWLRAPGANRFWANLVSWTLPATGSGRLFVSASSGAGQGHISVATPSALGANPSVTAHVLGPDGHSVTSQLEPSAPGQFQGSFQEAGQGTYFITVDALGAGHGEAGQVGLDVPYSPEYRTTGTNGPLLQAVAAAGGGSVLANAQGVWANNLAAVYANQPLTPWLWLLALLLLPLDVAVRRLVMTRRELLALRDAIPWRRPQAAPAEPALAPLGALRQRRAERVPVAAPIRAEPATRWDLMNRSRAPTGTEGIRTSTGRLDAAEGADGEPGPDDSTETSTASKLLAAKRKKR